MPAPADFLKDLTDLLEPDEVGGPVLDLACGDCLNGLLLAERGLEVECWDVSADALVRAEQAASQRGLTVTTRCVDLELPGADPLPANTYGTVLVFRYLHRPLFAAIREAVRPGGLLIYETFTRNHARFDRPRNPDHLLEPGELFNRFRDWEIIHYSEPILDHPPRAVARLACRKPE